MTFGELSRYPVKSLVYSFPFVLLSQAASFVVLKKKRQKYFFLKKIENYFKCFLAPSQVCNVHFWINFLRWKVSSGSCSENRLLVGSKSALSFMQRVCHGWEGRLAEFDATMCSCISIAYFSLQHFGAGKKDAWKLVFLGQHEERHKIFPRCDTPSFSGIILWHK